jgi:hypothetical protein
MKKRIKMLKPGRFTAMNGKVVNFTEAMLQATAAAYNPDTYAAPFVIGHPKHDDPAYGRIGTAEFAEGFLMGKPDQVDPAFAEAVNSGKFNRVSLSLYEPDSPNNPAPGVYYPRHLGFLGAMPPAVKGLGTVSFAEGETGIIELGDGNDRTIARLLRSLKNKLIEKFGTEDAEAALPEWDIESVREEALRPDIKTEAAPEAAFAETNQEVDAMVMTAEQLTAKEAELKQREDALKATVNAGIHEGNVAFAEGLVKGGKLLPVNKAAAVAALDFASGITAGDTLEFGEGDAKQTKAPADILRDLFNAMPKVIEFGELGKGHFDPSSQQGAIPADLAKHV